MKEQGKPLHASPQEAGPVEAGFRTGVPSERACLPSHRQADSTGVDPPSSPAAVAVLALARLSEIADRLIDSLDQTIAAGMKPPERSRAVADLDHLTRTVERLRDLVGDGSPGRSHDVVETLLEFMAGEDNAESEETSKPNQAVEGAHQRAPFPPPE